MEDFHIWFVRDEVIQKSGFGAWNFTGKEPPSFPEDYELVAHVEAPTHGSCFAIIQHLDTPWTDRREVKIVKDKPCRSMAVDDVVQNTRGEAWVVRNYGWEKIHHGN